MNKMNFFNKIFRKQNRFYIYTMIMVALFIIIMTTFSVYYMKSALERNNTVLLNEISEESSNLVSEKILRTIGSLQTAAGIMSQEDDIFSQKNIDDMNILVQEYGYDYMFLTDRQQENTVFSDGIRREQIKVISMLKKQDIIISDVKKSEDGENILFLSVPILKNTRRIGSLTGVYRAEEFARIMETTLFDGKGVHYIVKKTGEAIVLPENETVHFTFDFEKGFIQSDVFDNIPELSKLPGSMRKLESGIIKFINDENETNYLSYRPLGVSDWYLISVIPSGQFSLQNVTNIMLHIALLIDIVMILLAGMAIWFYKHDKKEVVDVDSITQLANKQKMELFYKKVSQKKGYTFAMIGVDTFNELTDTFGYAMGGQILKNIANIMQPFIKEDELVARLKEDCFGLFIKAKTKQDATRRLEEILSELNQLKVSENDYIYYDNIRCSAGINVLSEKYEFEKLLEYTTVALELAKQSNDKKIVTFEKELQQQLALRDTLLPDMYKALQNKEFVPYFLLQFDIENKEFTGAKAVATWKHPEKGVVMPENFVLVLKETGILLEMDMLLLEEVCKKQKDWIDRGLVPLPLTVSVARLNIHREDFFNRVKAIVERYDITPSLVILEIEEAAIYDDIDRNVALIEKLKEYGFMVSICHFSSQYAFLNIMKMITIDSIKLEKGFLPNGNITDKERMIIKSILDMAKELQIQIIVEGIQTDKQAKILKTLGCSIVEGYSYPEPVSEEAFEEMIFYEEI